MGESPKTKQDVIYNSVTNLSSDGAHEFLSDIEVEFAPRTLHVKKLPSIHVVTEPKHNRAAKHQLDAAGTISSLSEILKQRAMMDAQRMEMVQVCEEAKLKHEKDVQKVEMAKMVFAMEGADAMAKAAANDVIMQYLQS